MYHGEQTILQIDPSRAVESTPDHLEAVGGRDVPVPNLLRGFSYALDLSQGVKHGHAVRTAFLAIHIAREAGLSSIDQTDVFYAAYIKDSGCPAGVDVLQEIVDVNDIRTHAASHINDLSLVGSLKTVIRGFRPGASIAARVANLARDYKALKRAAPEMAQIRCTVGSSIANRLGLSNAVQESLLSITESYDGSGLPRRLRADEIPIGVRIIAVAQLTDAYRCMRSHEDAKRELRRRAGGQLDPAVADLQLKLLDDPLFVAEVDDPDMAETMSRLDPTRSIFQGDRARIRDIATAFSEVVDIKSKYTATHSRGTAAAAIAIGDELGLSADRLWNLELAALLHDLGKLSVPTSLLNKRSVLDEQDWLALRAHPEYTRAALKQTDLFDGIADLAASHHEKLDGSGYPHGMNRTHLSIEARILATADTFDALCGDRPYRDPISRPDVLRLLDGMVGLHLDGDTVNAVRKRL